MIIYIYLWYMYGICVEYPWGFTLDMYGIGMGYVWECMGYLLDIYGTSMGYVWGI